MSQMHSSLIICLLLCLISISSKVKADLPQSIFKEILKNNLVPKTWQEYICGNLYHFIQKLHKFKNFILLLQKLLQKAQILNNISHLKVHAEAKLTKVKSATGILALFPRDDPKTLLSYKNNLCSSIYFPFKACYSPVCLGYNWVFHPHHSFSTNITIQELFFSSGLSFCKEGTLQLKNLDTSSLNQLKDEDKIEKYRPYNKVLFLEES